MARKITAALLIATALPFSEALAHYGDRVNVPVKGYLYLMLGIGIVYFLFLFIRMQRKNVKTRKY